MAVKAILLQVALYYSTCEIFVILARI